MILTEVERTQIAQAIGLSEKQSEAEIVCMISPAASDYRFTPILWASMIALMMPWPFWWFTQIEISRILLAQLVLFCTLLFVFSTKKLRIWLTPKGIRRSDVERAASHQFKLVGIARTKQRAGVLLYVSVAERIAVVLPDEAVRQVLTLDTSEKALAALTKHLKSNQPALGFLAAIEVLTEKLKLALPANGEDNNELANSVIEL
jgi:putative membrane protein